MSTLVPDPRATSVAADGRSVTGHSPAAAKIARFRTLFPGHAEDSRRPRAPASAWQAWRRAIHLALEKAYSAATQSTVDALDALALDRALQKLEQQDPEQAPIVELRFFAGLTVEETAAVVGVSPLRTSFTRLK